jgi:ABC-type transport system substrate-binding protein
MYKADDDTIDWGFKSDLEQLNRISSEWLWDDNVLDLIYYPLMDYNPFTLDFTELWMAESYEVTTWLNPDTGEDATELWFSLKDGLEWHNGDPVTLEDVKFSMEFNLACGPGISWLYSNFVDLNSVDIVEGRVRVRMNSESVFALNWIGGTPIIKMDVWGNIRDDSGNVWTYPEFDFLAVRNYDPAREDVNENGIIDLVEDGTGPWIFDEYVEGSFVALRANTDFFVSQEELDARLSEMFRGVGDVDTDGSVATRDIALLLRGFGTTASVGGTPGEWGAWNPDADLDNDGLVSLKDLTTAGKNFGLESG